MDNLLALSARGAWPAASRSLVTVLAALAIAGCGGAKTEPATAKPTMSATDAKLISQAPAGTKAAIVHVMGFGTASVEIQGATQDCMSFEWEDPVHYSQVCWAYVPTSGSVTLTATPTNGSKFLGWGTGPCSGSQAASCALTMDRHHISNVGFDPGGATQPRSEYRLKVDVLGFVDGEIAATPSIVLDCQSSDRVSIEKVCTATVAAGTQVTLTATPTVAGSTFTGWGGQCSGTGSCIVTMDRDVGVTAGFAVPGSGGGGGTGGGGSGGGTAAPAWAVGTWSGTGTCVNSTLTATSAGAATYSDTTGAHGTGTLDASGHYAVTGVGSGGGTFFAHRGTWTQISANVIHVNADLSYDGVNWIANGGINCDLDRVVTTPPVIGSFTASPSTITAGQSTTLAWSVTGATSVSISGIGTVTGTSVTVTPAATTTYTLTGTNAYGATSATVTVAVGGTGGSQIPAGASRVFVTSQTFTGNLGGIVGADAKCQAAAQSAGLPGRYKAWLSIYGDGGPAQSFVHSQRPYVLIDGTVIANDWADLTKGSLSSPIALTEVGGAPPAVNSKYPLAWTNTTENGTPEWPGADCSGWTNEAHGPSVWGIADSTDHWSSFMFAGSGGCSQRASLHCFEQVEVSSVHRIGGVVRGLVSSGLVLATEGQQPLAVGPGAAGFDFPLAVPAGTAFDVRVQQQPAGQRCSVFHGKGIVAATDIGGVQILCSVDAPSRVFVTSQVFDGNLGGVRGADAKCQAAADAASLGGAFKAWVSSVAEGDPASRFVHSEGPYVLLSGALLARNWADLVDGEILTGIDVTEIGTVAPTGSVGNDIQVNAPMVWANTTSSGLYAYSGFDCAGWTSAVPGDLGFVGNATDGTVWSGQGSGSCSLTAALYCFEQIASPSGTPVASFVANPNPGAPGQSIAYDARNSTHTAVNRAIVQYAWDFGDGTTAAGLVVTHAYAKFGTYTVTLTVQDNNVPPLSNSVSMPVTINQGNQPPVAAFSLASASSAEVGRPVAFDARSSYDPDAAAGDAIVSYSWDFGDGGTGTGQAPSHAYSSAGTYIVRLYVTDTFGATGTITASVVVVVPTIAFGGMITAVGADRVHTFTTNGTFTVLRTGSVQVLVVGGGGGGGQSQAGGGGGGGVISVGAYAVTGGDVIQVTVGTGGAQEANGTDSTFGSLRAVGGGAGRGGAPGGASGGSGGGGAACLPGGFGTVGQGNNGGSGLCGGGSGGGGGGAGGAGAPSGMGAGGAGGNGFLNSINGTPTYYGGGGGGGGGTSAGPGGSGGGGAGGVATTGAAGRTNSGGGGGGGGGSTSAATIAGGPGGSGIVIVRYTPSSFAP